MATTVRPGGCIHKKKKPLRHSPLETSLHRPTEPRLAKCLWYNKAGNRPEQLITREQRCPALLRHVFNRVTVQTPGHKDTKRPPSLHTRESET